MSANQRGKTKAGKVHQFTCGVRQRMVGGGGYDKYEESQCFKLESVTLPLLEVRFAEIEAQFSPKIDRI